MSTRKKSASEKTKDGPLSVEGRVFYFESGIPKTDELAHALKKLKAVISDTFNIPPDILPGQLEPAKPLTKEQYVTDLVVHKSTYREYERSRRPAASPSPNPSSHSQDSSTSALSSQASHLSVTLRKRAAKLLGNAIQHAEEEKPMIQLAKEKGINIHKWENFLDDFPQVKKTMPERPDPASSVPQLTIAQQIIAQTTIPYLGIDDESQKYQFILYTFPLDSNGQPTYPRLYLHDSETTLLSPFIKPQPTKLEREKKEKDGLPPFPHKKKEVKDDCMSGGASTAPEKEKKPLSRLTAVKQEEEKPDLFEFLGSPEPYKGKMMSRTAMKEPKRTEIKKLQQQKVKEEKTTSVKKKGKKMACQNCRVEFSDYEEHRKTQQHELYANKISNFAEIDKQISTLPSLDDALARLKQQYPQCVAASRATSPIPPPPPLLPPRAVEKSVEPLDVTVAAVAADRSHTPIIIELPGEGEQDNDVQMMQPPTSPQREQMQEEMIGGDQLQKPPIWQGPPPPHDTPATANAPEEKEVGKLDRSFDPNKTFDFDASGYLIWESATPAQPSPAIITKVKVEQTEPDFKPQPLEFTATATLQPTTTAEVQPCQPPSTLGLQVNLELISDAPTLTPKMEGLDDGLCEISQQPLDNSAALSAPAPAPASAAAVSGGELNSYFPHDNQNQNQVFLILNEQTKMPLVESSHVDECLPSAPPVAAPAQTEIGEIENENEMCISPTKPPTSEFLQGTAESEKTQQLVEMEGGEGVEECGTPPKKLEDTFVQNEPRKSLDGGKPTTSDKVLWYLEKNWKTIFPEGRPALATFGDLMRRVEQDIGSKEAAEFDKYLQRRMDEEEQTQHAAATASFRKGFDPSMNFQPFLVAFEGIFSHPQGTPLLFFKDHPQIFECVLTLRRLLFERGLHDPDTTTAVGNESGIDLNRSGVTSPSAPHLVGDSASPFDPSNPAPPASESMVPDTCPPNLEICQQGGQTDIHVCASSPLDLNNDVVPDALPTNEKFVADVKTALDLNNEMAQPDQLAKAYDPLVDKFLEHLEADPNTSLQSHETSFTAHTNNRASLRGECEFQNTPPLPSTVAEPLVPATIDHKIGQDLSALMIPPSENFENFENKSACGTEKNQAPSRDEDEDIFGDQEQEISEQIKGHNENGERVEKGRQEEKTKDVVMVVGEENVVPDSSQEPSVTPDSTPSVPSSSRLATASRRSVPAKKPKKLSAVDKFLSNFEEIEGKIKPGDMFILPYRAVLWVAVASCPAAVNQKQYADLASTSEKLRLLESGEELPIYYLGKLSGGNLDRHPAAVDSESPTHRFQPHPNPQTFGLGLKKASKSSFQMATEFWCMMEFAKLMCDGEAAAKLPRGVKMTDFYQKDVCVWAKHSELGVFAPAQIEAIEEDACTLNYFLPEGLAEPGQVQAVRDIKCLYLPHFVPKSLSKGSLRFADDEKESATTHANGLTVSRGYLEKTLKPIFQELEIDFMSVLPTAAAEPLQSSPALSAEPSPLLSSESPLTAAVGRSSALPPPHPIGDHKARSPSPDRKGSSELFPAPLEPSFGRMTRSKTAPTPPLRNHKQPEAVPLPPRSPTAKAVGSKRGIEESQEGEEIDPEDRPLTRAASKRAKK